MAITFIGQSGFSASVGNSTPSITFLPYQDGDLWILAVESANQPVTPPDGWTEIPNSPQFLGTAATSSGVRLTVFYKWISGEENGPTILDTGDHTTSTISAFRGVDPVSPFHVSVGSIQDVDSDTIIFPSVTTTIDGCLILLMSAINYDGLTNNSWAEPVNANLSSLTRALNQTTSGSRGGGIYVGTGNKITAGATGETTAYSSNRVSTYANITLALTPEDIPVNIVGSISLSVGVQESTVSNKGIGMSLPITDGFVMSVVGVRYEPIVKTGTVAVTHGFTENVSGKKLARAPPKTVSHGYNDTVTGRKKGDSSVTLSTGETGGTEGKKKTFSEISISHGIQNEVLTKYRKKSEAISITAGMAMNVSGTGKKKNILSLSHGVQIIASERKTGFAETELQTGIELDIGAEKKFESELSLSDGIQINVTGTGRENVNIHITTGLQDTVDGAKNGLGATTDSYGDNIASYGKKASESLTAISNGDTVNVKQKKAGFEDLNMTTGAEIQNIAMKDGSGAGTITVGERINIGYSKTNDNERTGTVHLNHGTSQSLSGEKQTKTGISIEAGTDIEAVSIKKSVQTVTATHGENIAVTAIIVDFGKYQDGDFISATVVFNVTYKEVVVFHTAYQKTVVMNHKISKTVMVVRR